MLPSVINSGWLETDLLVNGLFGLSWLNPEQLFHLEIDSTVGHSLFWSLSINCALFILVSEKTTQAEKMSEVISFLNIANGSQHISYQAHCRYLPNQQTQATKPVNQ